MLSSTVTIPYDMSHFLLPVAHFYSCLVFNSMSCDFKKKFAGHEIHNEYHTLSHSFMWAAAGDWVNPGLSELLHSWVTNCLPESHPCSSSGCFGIIGAEILNTQTITRNNRF